MMKITAKHLKSLGEKNKGLLGRKKAINVYFETRFGIHTFFLNFPIDVVIMDNEFNVVKAKKLKKNMVFVWNPKYCKVLELPEGTIERLKLKPNDQIRLSLK